MKPVCQYLLLSAAVFLGAGQLPAQGGNVAVPPGREFTRQKVLTLGLTDTWSFSVTADEYVHCVVETSEFDPVLELVDASGERLGIDDGEGSRSALRLFAPVTGKVEFRVSGYERRGGGSYRFWLQRYRTEPLAPGAVPEHVFGPERWWHYRVAVQTGDVVVPRVLAGGRLTAVLDMGQRAVPEWHGGYRVPRDGQVLLRVEGNEHDRCRIEVRLARQSTLPAGGGLDAEMPAGGMDLVRHRFEPGAFALELDTPDAELTVDFRETSPGRHPRFCWTGSLDKNGRRRQWMLVREPMDAELVLACRGVAASYGGRFVRVEHPVELGATVTGCVPLGGGSLYEVRPEPGQLVRLTVASSAFDGRMDIWTPDGGVHRFDDGGRLDVNPTHTFLVSQRGAHRVLVYTSAGAGSGPFTLRTDNVPIPRLAIGEALPVTLRGGDAFVHLHLTAGQEVWFAVKSRAFDAALTVHDPNGRHVGTFEGGGVDGDVLAAIRADVTGTYTLRVQARSGAGAGRVRAIAP